MEPLSADLYSARAVSSGTGANRDAEIPDFTVEDLKGYRHNVIRDGLNSFMGFLIRLPRSPFGLWEDLWVREERFSIHLIRSSNRRRITPWETNDIGQGW